MIKILMVCLGNICRSPLAHGILESKLPPDRFFVDSAGTGNYHIGSSPDVRSIAVAKRNNLDISRQCCRQFQTMDFDNFDIIYVMDHSNYENVVKLARDERDISKVKLILDNHLPTVREVPDPYYGNESEFNEVFELLNTACEAISKDLLK